MTAMPLLENLVQPCAFICVCASEFLWVGPDITSNELFLL